MKWCNDTIKPPENQEIVVRARDGFGTRWYYQIGVWINGQFENPAMSCDMCGGRARFLPRRPWNHPIYEWLPLNEFLGIEHRLKCVELEKDRLYDRVLRAEEVMYESVVNGNDQELIDYVVKCLKNI